MSASRTERAAATALVVDDDERMLTLMGRVLADAGIASTTVTAGDAAVAAAREDRPDVVVLDVNLPGLSGYEVCRILRTDHGAGLPILFVSGDRIESYDRVAGLLIGADDYLVKPFAPDELVARVRTLLRRALPATAPLGLTAREHEVLRLLAAGQTQLEIAHGLVISPRTVGTHIERILFKLGVHSRAQAVARAFRDGLLGPHPAH
jgi:DNA-binding response OmpR family regulator